MNKASKIFVAVVNAYMQAFNNVFGLDTDYASLISNSSKEKTLFCKVNSLKNEQNIVRFKSYTKNVPTTNKTNKEIFKQF